MGALINIPTAATPADRILSRFNRDQLAGFIEVAISLLDAADGDPYVEANSDEQDGINSQDDVRPHSSCSPGCPFADPDQAADDLPCDEELGI
jgi:hypothetical protein